MLMVISERKSLEIKRLGMISYLRMKVEDSDWHAVADAAMDLREIDAAAQVHDKIEARRLMELGQDITNQTGPVWNSANSKPLDNQKKV